MHTEILGFLSFAVFCCFSRVSRFRNLLKNFNARVRIKTKTSITTKKALCVCLSLSLFHSFFLSPSVSQSHFLCFCFVPFLWFFLNFINNSFLFYSFFTFSFFSRFSFFPFLLFFIFLSCPTYPSVWIIRNLSLSPIHHPDTIIFFSLVLFVFSFFLVPGSVFIRGLSLALVSSLCLVLWL